MRGLCRPCTPAVSFFCRKERHQRNFDLLLRSHQCSCSSYSEQTHLVVTLNLFQGLLILPFRQCSLCCPLTNIDCSLRQRSGFIFVWACLPSAVSWANNFISQTVRAFVVVLLSSDYNKLSLQVGVSTPTFLLIDTFHFK